MEIAVVGGGIFGITSAIKLAEQGYRVDLFEKNDDILKAASGINQYRLHRGYHYPRSTETIISSKDSEESFKKEYFESILEDSEHYYAIAREGSLTSAKAFLNTLKANNLEFNIVSPKFISEDKIDLCVRVKEASIDPIKLREICWRRLNNDNIRVFLNTEATPDILRGYDFRILCIYSSINSLLGEAHGAKKIYQFELCEKPVVRLPSSFKKRSIVIMDGPFMCLDPYGATGLYVMGHVVHAIHQTNIGEAPIVDVRFKDLLNNGVVRNPHTTNFGLFISTGREFIPELAKAKHVGSMFTIRSVMPYKDDTDKRPTIVEEVDETTVSIFSGKIGNCVTAAEDVLKIIESKN